MCCLWLAYAVSQFPVRFFARCLAIRKCSSTRSLIGDSITCFNKSKIVCADSQGESPLMLHYIDAAMRQNREKVCFIKGKSKHLVSNHRSFREENINIFRKSYRFKKNKWTFFVPSLVSSISSLVFGKRFALLLARSLHSVFSHAHVRLKDTHLRITHSASSQY